MKVCNNFLLTLFLCINHNSNLCLGTDVSVEKILGIVIRYFSTTKNDLITAFLTLIDVNGEKAEDLLLGLERALKIYKLNIQNSVAIGTDNAASMTTGYIYY